MRHIFISETQLIQSAIVEEKNWPLVKLEILLLKFASFFTTAGIHYHLCLDGEISRFFIPRTVEKLRLSVFYKSLS